MGVVHFLLGDKASLRFRHTRKTIVLQVQHVVLGLCAANFALKAGDLVSLRTDGGIVLVQLGLQLRDFEYRHDLTFAHELREQLDGIREDITERLREIPKDIIDELQTAAREISATLTNIENNTTPD